MATELALIPIAFLTSALAAVMGMGGGLLLIAAMPGLLPMQAIFPIHACTQLFSNVSRAAFSWRSIDWSLVPALFFGALAGAWLGAGVYASLNLEWLPVVIGVLILIITWLRLPQVRGGGQLALLALGFYQTGLGMIAGATGPLGAAVMLQYRQQRDWLVVNTALYMSLSHSMRVAAYIALGFSFAPWWELVLAMAAAVTAGSWVGTRLRRFVPEINFQWWFRVLVTLLALRMIIVALLPT